MHKLIDANVILRYLLGDDPEMSAKAKDIVLEGAYTTTEILCEVVYVLKGVYSVERDVISDTLTALIDEIGIEHQAVINHALSVYSQTSLDFVDCLLVARHRILGDNVFTFDKKLNRVINSNK